MILIFYIRFALISSHWNISVHESQMYALLHILRIYVSLIVGKNFLHNTRYNPSTSILIMQCYVLYCILYDAFCIGHACLLFICFSRFQPKMQSMYYIIGNEQRFATCTRFVMIMVRLSNFHFHVYRWQAGTKVDDVVCRSKICRHAYEP